MISFAKVFWVPRIRWCFKLNLCWIWLGLFQDRNHPQDEGQQKMPNPPRATAMSTTERKHPTDPLVLRIPWDSRQLLAEIYRLWQGRETTTLLCHLLALAAIGTHLLTTPTAAKRHHPIDTTERAILTVHRPHVELHNIRLLVLLSTNSNLLPHRLFDITPTKLIT